MIKELFQLQIEYSNKKCWSELNVDNIPFSKQKIGVIDGPINSNLVKKIKNQEYFSDEDGEKDSMDLTHASIVCSIIQNISPLSEISIAQVFSKDGSKASTKSVVNALKWLVIKEKVNIINMSLGFYNNCSGHCAWDRILKQIKEKYHVVVIVSAGNTCSEHPGASITSPGCSSEVITVGGLDEDLCISNEMNVDKIEGKPELYANGIVNIKLLDGQTQRVEGTSFAAPIITGLIDKYYADIIYSSIPEKQFSENIKNIFCNIIHYIQKVSDVEIEKKSIEKLKEISNDLINEYKPAKLEINNVLTINYLKKKLKLSANSKSSNEQKKTP